MHIFHLQERPFTMWLDCWPLLGYCVSGDEVDFAVILLYDFLIFEACVLSGFWNAKPLFPDKDVKQVS